MTKNANSTGNVQIRMIKRDLTANSLKLDSFE